MTDVRCDNGILFGRLERGVLEVKCRSQRCGAYPGIVVLHRFDLATGELVATNRYKDFQPKRGQSQ